MSVNFAWLSRSCLMFVSAAVRVSARTFFRGLAEGLLALLGLAERELRLAEVQQRDRVAGIGLEHLRELHGRDVVARRLLIVQRLHEQLIVRALLRIEFVVADEVRDAVRKARVIGQILIDQTIVIGLRRAEVLHERHHRIGIVAGARHQQQSVLVGLEFVGARLFRDQPGLARVARSDR